MAVRVEAEKCTGCGSCVDVCPMAAITVEEVAVINEDGCVECGTCVEECPNGALVLE
ncbi:4Fe-4S binding protein [Moorellaceae bacterium AZ2]